MNLEEAFAPGVNPETFFESNLPSLLKPYLDRFSDLSEVDLVVGIRLLGEDECEWTLTIDGEECDVEEGEGFDEPLITMIGERQHWEWMRGQIQFWAQAIQSRFEDHLDEGVEAAARYRLTSRRFDALSQIDGKIVLRAHGVPGQSAPLESVILLNSFTDEGQRALTVDIQHADMLALLNDELSLPDLMEEGRVKLGGWMTLPMKIAGAFMAY